MITLSKSGNSVTFTFDENSGYLQNGTIDVPVNSLALITDESDMATFRKAASNDIFVSARYAEFGMSKSELESWYKANMVSSGGGGGGGVTPEEVQSMIDESISGLTEEELRIASTSDVVIQWSSSASTNFPAGCTKIVVSNPVPDYYHGLVFYDASGNSLGNYSIRYYWGSWTIENGFNGSSYTTSGETLTITWSADKGVASLYDRENGTAYTVTAVDIVTETPLKDVVEDKLDTSVFEVYSGGVATALSGKQDQLSAGRAISITNNTVAFDLPISAGTGTNSLIMSGSGNTASGGYSVAYGKLNSASGECSTASGNRNTSNNFAEAAFGQMNISRTEDASSFGHSGNTIYTIGNGVINASGENKNHNAFEVRGNGDVYIADTNATGVYYEKPMIKLQDALGGSVDSAITSASTNAVENGAIWSAVTYNKEITLDFSGSNRKAINFPDGCTTIKVTLDQWNSCMLYFYDSIDGHIEIGDYNISYDYSLTVNNNFNDSTYTISGNVITITWAASAGVVTVSKNGQGTVAALVSGAWVNENTYMKGEVDTIQTTLQNNINQKLDSTAYTPTVVDSSLSITSENPVQNKVLFGELRAVDTKDPDTVITWSNYESSNFPSGCTSIVVNVPNYGDSAYIGFSDTNNHSLGYYDISNRGDIRVSNSFDGSTYTTSGTSVTIIWDSSKNVAKLMDDAIGNSPSVTAIGATTYISVKNSLGGFKLLQITQSDYDALQNYDANTLYIIVN